MHDARWQLRKVWRSAALAFCLTADVALAEAALAGVGVKSPPPLVFENRYVVAAEQAGDAAANSPHEQRPQAEPHTRQIPVATIDDLLARAAAESGSNIEPAAPTSAEALNSAIEPPATLVRTEPKPQAQSTAEPATELERIAESLIAKSSATPSESQTPPPEPAAPPTAREIQSIQPTTPRMESYIGPVEAEILPIEPPSEPWGPPVVQPANEAAPPLEAEVAAPLPIEPEREMVDDLEAVWSEGFESAPAPALESNFEPSATSGAVIVMPYAPTTAELSRQLLPMVRKAYGLAQHGAVYAAQTEFIQVLRRIAEAKDAAEGVDTHAQALAAGLRAIDEADDFAPQGAQLEADMNVGVMVSSHRTPVLLHEGPIARPAEAISLYHQFARQQLTYAVAGERAGSMALYGLGKVQNRLAYEADGELRHERKALTMFLAALDAGPGNHLAANEIGVLLSRGGQPAEAAAHFCRAIDLAPTSTSYHNLAVVERTMGYDEQAAANEQYAWHLAQRDRSAGVASRARGVQWVAPQELSRFAQPLPIEAGNGRLTNATQQLPQPPAAGPVQSVAKWPQKLVPGVFRR